MFIVIPLCLSITSSIFKRFLTPRVISMSQRPVGRLILLPILSMATIPMLVSAHVDPTKFTPSAFVEKPAVVECNLEDGSSAQCYKFTVAYQPEGLEIGPFCPSNIDEKGGIWDWDGEKAGLYRLDRDFFEMLADQGYRFYDKDGRIVISDPGSGQPPEADHTCLMATPDKDVTITMLLPIEPRMAEKALSLGTVAKVGVALDGVPIFADAPSVLDTGHLPALDVCGGHIDPGGWYHWHATSTDIATVEKTEGVAVNCALAQDASAALGFAFDGFPMFGSLEADGSKPEGLDKCHGHMGETRLGKTYHYHASTEFPNLPTCLSGVVAENNFSTTSSTGIGSQGNARRGPGQGMPPGFEEAAQILGGSTEDLMNALKGNGQRPNIAAAAEKLGVTEKALRSALPQPPQHAR